MIDTSPFMQGADHMASVIVVEDEEDFRASLREVLAYAGFTIIDAGSADTATHMLQEQQDIQLLVTDIDLPGELDGVALANVARKQHPNMPVIFISGQPLKMSKAWAFDGPAAFFHKPFSFNMLVNAAQGFIHPLAETPSPATLPPH
jgi:DNA-binding NtrC family response regulator